MSYMASERGTINASLDNPSSAGASERGLLNAALFPMSSSGRGTLTATLTQPSWYEWRNADGTVSMRAIAP